MSIFCRLLLRAGFLVLFLEPSFAASFNCGKKNLLPDERTVCSDAALSRLDDELTSAYQDILRSREVSADTIAQEQKNERGFLVKRKSCVTDVGCIQSLYTVRLAELRAARGIEDIELEKAPQAASLVDQAIKLLSLSLTCPSEPVRDGYALYYKFEHESLGDRSTLRVMETQHTFEGFKFENGRPVQSDTPISGVNAGTQTTQKTTFTVALRSIGRVSVNRNVGSLDFNCSDDKPCIDLITSSNGSACKSLKGSECNYGTSPPAREKRQGATLSGICAAQLKNAGDALSILVSAATFGQTK
jgi:uncharacterized protein